MDLLNIEKQARKMQHLGTVIKTNFMHYLHFNNLDFYEFPRRYIIEEAKIQIYI